MLRRAAIALAVGAALAIGAAPASAIPTIPNPQPEMLHIISYYSDFERTHLAGQVWSGCGQSGNWGVVTRFPVVSEQPCG